MSKHICLQCKQGFDDKENVNSILNSNLCLDCFDLDFVSNKQIRHKPISSLKTHGEINE